VKSVSAAWALARLPIARAIEDCRAAAVADVLRRRARNGKRTSVFACRWRGIAGTRCGYGPAVSVRCSRVRARASKCGGGVVGGSGGACQRMPPFRLLRREGPTRGRLRIFHRSYRKGWVRQEPSGIALCSRVIAERVPVQSQTRVVAVSVLAEFGGSSVEAPQHAARNRIKLLGVGRLGPGGDCLGKREGGEFGRDRSGGIFNAA
jgi:hypothetical protein